VKRHLYKIYGFFHSLKHPTILKATVSAMLGEEVEENRAYMKAAADWLLSMQNNDGGYSRKFSLIGGRDPSYIETTGYIIPTLWKVGERLSEQRYIDSAKRAGEWLLRIQNENGSFNEIDYNTPFAFDTGQCLIGLNFLYRKTEDNRFLNAAKKAAYWLKENQESDASWLKVAYNRQKHSYYSRVAAAMLEYGFISGDEKIKHSALKSIDWILKQQAPNGFFAKSSFLEGMPPFLHTVIYVYEGLLDVYEMTGESHILEAVLKAADTLKTINLKRDLILCSQYNEAFECVNKERCLTGLAQWAGIALRLYEISGDKEYLVCAKNTIFYLKAKQIKSSEMKGGFSASIPFWGRYGGFDFVNWNNKFFLDALLGYDAHYRCVTDEQESFVATAFVQTEEVVTDKISFMDRQYLERLRRILPKERLLKVLDIGCGKGVIIKTLSEEFRNIEFFGIDPVYENAMIKKGSIYNIPFEEDFFDVVLCFEVLQHTYIDSALKEIKRVSKSGAMVVIGERNPFSILGFLKPLLELSGRWMYPWDSPFKERWYGKKRWIQLLKTHGFDRIDIETIESRGKRWVHRYFFIKGRVD